MAASASDKARKTYSYLQKTLSSGISDTDTVLTPNNLTHIPTDTGVSFVVDRVDSSGNKTPDLRELMTGYVSGSTIAGLLRGEQGTTAQPHLGNAVIEFVNSGEMWNDLIDFLLQDHSNPNGNHKTLTDANGNEWLEQGSVASAVNQVKLSNAATGNAPSAGANGDDTNIDYEIYGKGTGSPRFRGYYDGWVKPNEAWTYASYDSTNATGVITVADGTGKYNVGNRVKFTNNSSVQYGIITAVGATSITVYFGTDYSLTNSAITLPYFSREKSPQGFPMDPTKWTVITVQSTNSAKTSPTAGTWYGNTALSGTGPNISLPIGAWRVGYWSSALTSDTANPADVYVSLSTSASSESDSDFTTRFRAGIATGTVTWVTVLTKEKQLAVAAATTYYLICKTGVASSSTVGVSDSNSPSTIIRALCVYL